jgi:hypothetical protein
MKMYLRKIFVILLTGIIFMSCTINKSVYLSPIEPFEYSENNIEFSISETQPFWISFQAPLLKKLPSIKFLGYIRTNENIENVYLKTISLNIKELNISLNKENVMIQIPNISNRLTNSSHNFVGHIDVFLFETMELLNEYDPNISLNNFYNKFNKVKEIEYCMTIIYEIDSQYYETEVVWKYSSKKNTSFARWDAIMGI